MTAGVRFDDAEAPAGMRLYAIGDVHGRADCLEILLGLIDAEIAHDRPDDWRIIFLGDYVDRGPDSARVVDTIARRVASDPRHIALAGNHDERFAMFLVDIAHWPQFEDFGGRETMRSYGVELRGGFGAALVEGHRALVRAVPQTHVAFLNALAVSVEVGDFFFCHAGIRPGAPLDAQDRRDLLWIRHEFHNHQGLYAKVIVHGHTPHDEPEIRANRVNLDTCAFASGRLTAIAIEGREKRFLEAIV